MRINDFFSNIRARHKNDLNFCSLCVLLTVWTSRVQWCKLVRTCRLLRDRICSKISSSTWSHSAHDVCSWRIWLYFNFKILSKFEADLLIFQLIGDNTFNTWSFRLCILTRKHITNITSFWLYDLLIIHAVSLHWRLWNHEVEWRQSFERQRRRDTDESSIFTGLLRVKFIQLTKKKNLHDKRNVYLRNDIYSNSNVVDTISTITVYHLR